MITVKANVKPPAIQELIPGHIYGTEDHKDYIFVGYGDLTHLIGSKIRCVCTDKYLYIPVEKWHEGQEREKIDKEFKRICSMGFYDMEKFINKRISPIRFMEDKGEFLPNNFFTHKIVKDIGASHLWTIRTRSKP